MAAMLNLERKLALRLAQLGYILPSVSVGPDLQFGEMKDVAQTVQTGCFWIQSKTITDQGPT